MEALGSGAVVTVPAAEAGVGDTELPVGKGRPAAVTSMMVLLLAGRGDRREPMALKWPRMLPM